MRKIKKMIALAACAIMATSAIFTGCGKATNDSNSKGNTPTKLTWYAIGEEPKDLDKVLAEANKYLGDKINVNLDMKFIGFGDYNTKNVSSNKFWRRL